MAVHISDPSDLKLRFSYFRTPYVTISLEKRSRTWFYFCSRTLWLTSFYILYIILTFGTLMGFYFIFFFHLLSDPFHFDFKEVIEESDLSVAHSFRNVRILTPKSLTVGILQNDIWSTEVPHKIDECRETRQKAGEYRWTSWEAVSSDGTYSSLETFKFTSITRHRGYHYYRPETSSSFLWSDRFPCFSFLLHSGPLSFQ